MPLLGSSGLGHTNLMWPFEYPQKHSNVKGTKRNKFKLNAMLESNTDSLI